MLVPRSMLRYRQAAVLYLAEADEQVLPSLPEDRQVHNALVVVPLRHDPALGEQLQAPLFKNSSCQHGQNAHPQPPACRQQVVL